MAREEAADLEDEPVHLPEERPGEHAPIEEEKAFGPETMDEAVKELSKPVEMVTIYLSRPLRRRTGAAVLKAVQEVCLQLDRNGTPVRNIHTDRAREFGTAQMKAWLAHQQITRTTTSGSEPAGNATAERGVRWYKARARALLRANFVEKGFSFVALVQRQNRSLRTTSVVQGKGLQRRQGEGDGHGHQQGFASEVETSNIPRTLHGCIRRPPSST